MKRRETHLLTEQQKRRRRQRRVCFTTARSGVDRRLNRRHERRRRRRFFRCRRLRNLLNRKGLKWRQSDGAGVVYVAVVIVGGGSDGRTNLLSDNGFGGNGG